ncbi:MAG: sialate O-acetylesterase [Planctomycetaceae bacterium]|nr:sialate O-acetylesterase [Planctomycetaceae bacterium]
MKRILLFPLIVCLALVAQTVLFADVKLPALIGENMVLQRDLANTLWGWADAGEKITVEFNGQTKTTKTDDTGKWSLKLDPVPHGGPFEMKITGKNTIELGNILVGDVWVCSGQSNMQWTVKDSNDPENEIANANYPNIRLITVPRASSSTPKDDFDGKWVECSPETIPGFTAVGYYFGREIHQRTNIPIGLLHSSWGGSSCETWINPDVVSQYKGYEEIMKRKAAAEVQKPEGGDNQNAGYLYNAMIVPIKNYGIKGAIWYQGETNAKRAYQYRTLFPLMIQNWREEWGQGDFPFYFVQLANFKAVKEEPSESDWAELREAQSMTAQSLRNTGQAVIIDLGEAKDIHPRNKQDVGLRLALLSFAQDVQTEVLVKALLPSEGPRFRSLKIEGNKAIISYEGGSQRGLKTKDGGAVKGFAMAGADRKFYWADAKIEGENVVLTCPEVPHPVAVRYAWADNPVCNLYNEAGLPACPFRTDMWPGVTINEQ